jgi:hypothetical protein
MEPFDYVIIFCALASLVLLCIALIKRQSSKRKEAELLKKQAVLKQELLEMYKEMSQTLVSLRTTGTISDPNYGIEHDKILTKEKESGLDINKQ